MVKVFYAAALVVSLVACDDKKDESTPIVLTPAGVADITLTMDGAGTYELNGPCGWAYAGGVGYVGANQESNSLKTFSIDTNLTELPSGTTTFTLTDDALDESPTKARIHITEFTGGSNYISWDSNTSSGTVTFTVNGNEITVNLNGITLEADNANATPYNHDGTLVGNLKFYRQ